MSASDVVLEPAGPKDMPEVMNALKALARDMGDPFKASDNSLSEALFGSPGFALALLARRGGHVVGVALAAPLFSTSGGGAVLYVSDLWVDPAVRRQALGKRLLAEALSVGAARWRTTSIKLTVYSDNTQALDFYAGLGFVLQEKDRSAILSPERANMLRQGLARPGQVSEKADRAG